MKLAYGFRRDDSVTLDPTVQRLSDELIEQGFTERMGVASWDERSGQDRPPLRVLRCPDRTTMAHLWSCEGHPTVVMVSLLRDGTVLETVSALSAIGLPMSDRYGRVGLPGWERQDLSVFPESQFQQHRARIAARDTVPLPDELALPLLRRCHALYLAEEGLQKVPGWLKRWLGRWLEVPRVLPQALREGQVV